MSIESILPHLLAMLGSNVHVLIADCGVTNNRPKQYSVDFKNRIERHAAKRGIRNIEYIFMQDIFSPRCEGCDEFHRHFQNVISQLTFEQLVAINQKQYSDDIKEKIKRELTLDFLRPALTISSVLHLSNKIGGKCIVIAGDDEHIQWEGAQDKIPYTWAKFGVLFNPILNEKEGHQGHQTENWLLYFSWQHIVRDMARYDLAVWLTKLLIFLPAFPASAAIIDGVSITPDIWEKGTDIEGIIDKDSLAKEVFTKILTI